VSYRTIKREVRLVRRPRNDRTVVGRQRRIHVYGQTRFIVSPVHRKVGFIFCFYTGSHSIVFVVRDGSAYSHAHFHPCLPFGIPRVLKYYRSVFVRARVRSIIRRTRRTSRYVPFLWLSVLNIIYLGRRAQYDSGRHGCPEQTYRPRR